MVPDLNAKAGSRALIAMASGTWGTADVVARHKNLDLLLLWVPREKGSATFVQPVAKAYASERRGECFCDRASRGTEVHAEYGNHFAHAMATRFRFRRR